MKKLFAFLLALVMTCSAFAVAFAADVSGYDAHATINLEPFKSDFYAGAFDDMSYTAQIQSSKSIKIDLGGANEYLEIRPRIDMITRSGIENFNPYLSISTNSKYARGIYIKIGENRYLATIQDESIQIGSGLFAILEEIATTSLPVQIAVTGRTRIVYTLTEADLSLIINFADALRTSGLADQLPDDEVIIITKYN